MIRRNGFLLLFALEVLKVFLKDGIIILICKQDMQFSDGLENMFSYKIVNPGDK